jgi:hypothetical protein
MNSPFAGVTAVYACPEAKSSTLTIVLPIEAVWSLKMGGASAEDDCADDQVQFVDQAVGGASGYCRGRLRIIRFERVLGGLLNPER